MPASLPLLSRSAAEGPDVFIVSLTADQGRTIIASLDSACTSSDFLKFGRRSLVTAQFSDKEQFGKRIIRTRRSQLFPKADG